MASNGAQVEDDYFNDLSRQLDLPPAESSKSTNRSEGATTSDQAAQPRQKRVACIICRKRKLKCDGDRPSCGTCSRLNHTCSYDEVRRKSGPKRGYVKELEARLAQVEAQVKKDSTSPPAAQSTKPPPTPASSCQNVPPNTSYDATGTFSVDMAMPMEGLLSTANNFAGSPSTNMVPDIDFNVDENFSWEMIGLGLEEPLPTQDAVDELTNTYFETIHPSSPMIHKYRYFAAMNLSPHMRPAVCLRYAMWTNAASISDKFKQHQDILYRRARKYAEYDEMRGQGQDCVTVAHSQTWSLIATYEFKNMYFPRAWMSVARAARLALMMGLNRMDGAGVDVKQCLAPPKDWTEREERRRAYWMAYCSDRFASVGTGWPMIMDERDIMSNLPCSERAYQSSTPEATQSLSTSMTPQGASSISSFAGVVFMAHFFGKNLHHLHRPGPDDREDDLQGEFWRRHRGLDNILLHKSLSLPTHLRLPAAVRDCNAIFINMAIHTSTICLHQAAIFKAERNGLPSSLIEQSQNRCNLAAIEITNILKLISHLDTSGINPYTPFCLYIAARVFVQYLKTASEDNETRSSLNFLLTAMEWLRPKNPLSESFLVQLGLDLHGNGLDTLLHNPDATTLLKESPLCPFDLEKNHENANRLANGAVNSKSPSSSGAPSLPEPAVLFPGKDPQTSNRDKPQRHMFMPLDNESSENIYGQMNTFEVPSGETRRPPPQQSQQGSYPRTKDNISTFKGPSGLFPGGWTVDAPAMDDAYQAPTPPSNNTPSGLTPADSQNASSATSYSSRQDEGGKSATNEDATQIPNVFSLPSLSHQTTNSSCLDDSSNCSLNMPSNQTSTSDAFKIPPGWDFGAGNIPMPTGNTPLPSGMSPPANGDWSQLLGSMSWSAVGPEAGNQNRKPNAGASPRYGYLSGFLYDTESDKNPNRMGK